MFAAKALPGFRAFYPAFPAIHVNGRTGFAEYRNFRTMREYIASKLISTTGDVRFDQ